MRHNAAGGKGPFMVMLMHLMRQVGPCLKALPGLFEAIKRRHGQSRLFAARAIADR